MRLSGYSSWPWSAWRRRVDGLINASYVPTPEIAELRDLTRYRRKLVGTASAERNRTLKLLETANIKLASVAADVFGVSGLAIAACVGVGGNGGRGDGGSRTWPHAP